MGNEVIKIGDEFLVRNKKFAFNGFTNGSSILAYRVSDMSPRRFKRNLSIDDVSRNLTGTRNEKAVALHEESIQRKQKANARMYSMVKGQIFIGDDGVRYVFTSVRRTKFALTSLDGEKEYTATPQFIKEALDEYKE
jgi:hypothetical protein